MRATLMLLCAVVFLTGCGDRVVDTEPDARKVNVPDTTGVDTTWAAFGGTDIFTLRILWRTWYFRDDPTLSIEFKPDGKYVFKNPSPTRGGYIVHKDTLCFSPRLNHPIITRDQDCLKFYYTQWLMGWWGHFDIFMWSANEDPTDSTYPWLDILSANPHEWPSEGEAPALYPYLCSDRRQMIADSIEANRRAEFQRTLDVSRLWGTWATEPSSVFSDPERCQGRWVLTLTEAGTAISDYWEVNIIPHRCYGSRDGGDCVQYPGKIVCKYTTTGTYVLRGDTLYFDFDVLTPWGTGSVRSFTVMMLADQNPLDVDTLDTVGTGRWIREAKGPPPATSDGFVYYAPQVLAPPVIDGDPGDWPSDDELPWEPINHYCEGSGQGDWKGWNRRPNSPEDLTAKFKMMWGYVGSARDVPVLYVLVHWMDDEFHFRPPEEGGKWDNTDVFQFWLCERCVAEGIPQSRVLNGWYIWQGGTLGIDLFRQSNVFLGDDAGVRVVNPAQYNSDRRYPVAPNMPYTTASFYQVSATEAYIEEQWQLYHRYPDQYLEILPGETVLPLGISGVNDYDSYDGSFSYITWGLSNRGLNDSLFSEVVLMPPLR